ncbi:MAG: ABC transporter permease [Deltaproteobacteria bacterium]|nr:ABC transporter permease [Deltaproteobacteria bacterium]
MLKGFWRTFKQRKTAVFGLVVVLVMISAVIFAPFIAPYGPRERIGSPYESPGWKHLLGTNDMGVDLFSELLYAGRVSLFVGLVAASFLVLTGSIVGMISGYLGGIVDSILMRIADLVLVLPRLPLMVVIAAYLGPGMWTIIFAFFIVGWAPLARQLRAQILSLKEMTFVEASKATGASTPHIIVSHILPNVFGIIVANFVMDIMYAILAEAGLSFLGLGDPTHKSWGVMLYFAQIQGGFLRGAWWWVFPPGLCISIVCCSFNFIGTAINDLFGLKLAKR